MTGKILIYGGSGGIGSATARALSQRGYDLHLTGRHKEKLTAIREELGAGYSVGDVTDPSFFKRATEEAGAPLAGLVYAVGTINLKGLSRLGADEFLDDFRINALGAALAVQAATGALKKHEGVASVVLYSSAAARVGFRFHASVGMAKGAVSGLTHALAAELAPDIRVNAVAPSLTDTPLAAPILSNGKMADAIAELHALRRLGRPEDIASLSAFLISEEAGWITGQIIGVDGGRSTTNTKS